MTTFRWPDSVPVNILDAFETSLPEQIERLLKLHARSACNCEHDQTGDQHGDNYAATDRKPVVICNLQLGACLARWNNPNYLISAVSSSQPDVSVHVSSTPDLHFLNKNFSYVSMPFKDLVSKLVHPPDNERRYYYYRAISTDSIRSKEPANFFRDFPGLAGDLTTPNFIPSEQIFSSVLRLSSPSVRLWLHYDIMDNILVQIHGRKQVLLFHPSDAKFLYMQGDKSQVREFMPQPDFENFPLLRHCRPYLATLHEGDALFIPALWLHYVVMNDADDEKADDANYSIAVNIFWRHLDRKFYNDRDTYGNRDLVPAEKAFEALQRACKLLKSLPEPYRGFYTDRAKQTVSENLDNHSINKNQTVNE